MGLNTGIRINLNENIDMSFLFTSNAKLHEKDLEGKLGNNMYLVFGNYPGNIDSGKFGPILREDILGKVLFK